jgi:3-isopropylmalate/(R)-2-methylmalate dehydratase small subunit
MGISVMVPGISSFGNARIREIGAGGRVFRLRMPRDRAMNPAFSHTPVMPLEKITSVTGRGAYVPGSDIDTDRIIPARFMKCVTFDGLGEYLFYDVRHEQDGTLKSHPLNEDRFAGASILISGINFGCGSSREHAPQAINKGGFRAVIAQSFAEIFFGNCATLGMPCALATAADIERLGAAVNADPSTEIVIDIDKCEVRFGDQSIPVTIPSTARDAFLSGQWDPIAELLDGSGDVAATAGKLAYMVG